LLAGELSPEQHAELGLLQAKANAIEEKIGIVRQTEVQQIEAIIAKVSDSANVYIGGSYFVGIRLVEIVEQDLLYFGLAISVLISGLLLMLFRSVRWLIFPLFVCVSSVALTMGILSLLKIPATIISANFVALQLILTIAIMLHLITCYREISRGNIQFTQHERLKAALTEKLAPCFFQQYNIEIVIRVQRPINLRREFSVCCEPNFRTTHLQ
jgi:predicted RND superfamily exporter protein